MNDVYYEPGKFGLEPVAEIDYSSGAWEFDLRVIWRDQQGRLLTARDAGCSCPSPFEGKGLDDLALVEDVADDLVKEAQEELRDPAFSYVSENDVAVFLGKAGISWPPLPATEVSA